MKELNHPKNVQGFSPTPHFFMSQDEIKETVLTFLKIMTIKTALPSPNHRLCPKLKEMSDPSILTFAHCLVRPQRGRVLYYLPYCSHSMEKDYTIMSGVVLRVCSSSRSPSCFVQSLSHV